MPSRHTHRWRVHIIAIARLLGYTFVRSNTNAFYVENPDGGKWRAWAVFKFKWPAAVAILEDNGIDAELLDPPGKDGAGRGRVRKVRVRRTKLERAATQVRRFTRGPKRPIKFSPTGRIIG